MTNVITHINLEKRTNINNGSCNMSCTSMWMCLKCAISSFSFSFHRFSTIRFLLLATFFGVVQLMRDWLVQPWTHPVYDRIVDCNVNTNKLTFVSTIFIVTFHVSYYYCVCHHPSHCLYSFKTFFLWLAFITF